MTVPNPSTAEAMVMVDELVRNGVKRAVIAPGSRSAALALALAGHPGIELATEIDERSAGFLALGSGLAGDMAAVVTTSGTAAANLLPAIVEADAAGVPLLALTADRPPELRQAGANQVIDQIKLYGERVRFFAEVGPAEDLPTSNGYWRSVVCQGVAAARGMGRRPGPVHLNLGFREPTVPVADDGRSSAGPFESGVDGRPGGLPWSEVAPVPMPRVTVAERWQAARGLVLAGDCRAEGGAVAAAMAAALGWPLIAEPHSGARGQGAISTAHYLLGHDVFAESHRPEVIIQLGRVGLSRRVATLANSDIPRLVFDPWAWSDPSRSAVAVHSALPEIPTPRPSGRWLEGWAEAEAVARAALDAALDALGEPSEPRTARDLARIAGEHPLVVSSSMPVRDLDLVMEAGGPEILANRGASGIDGFVSTALGVSWGRGGPVLALAGDLSMLHDQAGLLVEPRPPVVFVVNNNDGGGLFHFLPQSGVPGFEQLFATPHHRRFGKVAELHGLAFGRIESAEDLIPMVESALAEGTGWLVEVPGDRIRNVEVHEQIEKAVTAALS